MTLQLMAIACSSTVLILFGLSSGSDVARNGGLRFSESVRAPCTAISGSDRDPCEHLVEPNNQSSQDSNAHMSGTPPLPLEPEWLYRLEWNRRTPQLVMRGIVAPDSSRCSEANAYIIGGDYGIVEATSRRVRIMCHADIDVSEYLVGSGPARVPFIAYWRPSIPRDAVGYGTDAFFSELAEPVRDELEGVEFVFELARPHDLAWGDWRLVHAWNVQRKSDGTIVGRSGIWHHHTHSTDVEDWEIPIDELQPKLKAAHAKVAAEYGGRISDEPDSPMLVTNAGRPHLLAQLRELGAYDSPDITPVPAPPAPIPPIEPGDVTASQPNDDGGILISWSASPSGDAVGYKIVRRVPKGEFVTVVADTGSTDTTYTDTSAPVTAGATYIYRVLALNKHGESIASKPASVHVP